MYKLKCFKKNVLFGIFFLFICQNIIAQYSPYQNAVLNFTQVMLETKEVPNAVSYLYTIRNAQQKIVFTKKTKMLTCLVNDVLQFGESYFWNVTAFTKNNKTIVSDFFTFRIATNPILNKKNLKFTILKSERGKFQNDILFIDNLGIAINRKGVPVWFLPEKANEGKEKDKNNYRTLQMTQDGTITYMYNGDCIETDLYGDVLWKAPNNGSFSGDATEYYHHDFSKMPFGSYMCASYKYINEKHFFDTSIIARVRYNTLIEYDKYGNILWSWNEKDNIDRATIYQNEQTSNTEVAGTHLNGFAFNKKDFALYLSCRNTSQIYKVHYPKGNVDFIWNGNEGLKDTSLRYHFLQQHGPSLTSNGELIVYDNNINANTKANGIFYPRVLILSQPEKNKPTKTIWEYECKWSKKPDGIQTKEGFAKELDNNNLLVNIGGTERIFEINRNKKIVWDCTFSRLDEASNTYFPFYNYRCYNTKSLYPIYFTLQSTGKKNQVLLHNAGSSSDSYTVSIFTTNEEALITTMHIEIVSGSTTKLVDLTKSIDKKWNNVVVQVTSKTNKNISKKITLF